MFVKEGNKGIKQFYSRAGPVKESLKPVAEIEHDLERDAGGDRGKTDEMKATGIPAGEHVEHDGDEKSSEREKGSD